MKSATYNGIEMSIRYSNSRGHYLVEGLGLKAETTNAEVYDYFDTDYYDENDKDYARQIAYDLIADAAFQKYGNLCYTFNADPSIVEDEDTALELAKLSDKGSIRITQNDVDEDEWSILCELVGLEPSEADIIYKLGEYGREAIVAI